jgi:hypothetical protein
MKNTMRHALVRALRTRGVDVVTALECDLIAQSDEANLEFATAQGRVLYSYNIGDYCPKRFENLKTGNGKEKKKEVN